MSHASLQWSRAGDTGAVERSRNGNCHKRRWNQPDTGYTAHETGRGRPPRKARGLSNQLQSSAGRRRRLSQELRAQPEGAPRAGIEGQLAVLDTRLMQLETDIAATGRQLSAAPLAAVSGAGPLRGNDIPENVAALSGAFTVFVLFPIALAYARRIWKGSSRTPLQTAFPPESAQRLERLEQGMEAIAIEIERVAEGQRFVTRLLSEAAPAGKIGSISHQAEAHRT